MDDTKTTESENGTVEKPIVKRAQDDLRPVAKATSHRTRNAVILLLLTIILLVLSLWAYVVYQSHPPQPSASQSTPTVQPQKTAVVDSSELARFVTPTTGETWLSAPKPIASKGWLTADDKATYQISGLTQKDVDASYEAGRATYYEVGTRAGKTIIVASLQGMGTSYYRFFELSSDDTVAMIVEPDSYVTYDQVGLRTMRNELTPKVNIGFDTSTHYDSLSIPRTMKLTNGEILTLGQFASINPAVPLGKGVTRTEIQKFGGSTLYRDVTAYADTKLSNVNYTMALPANLERTLDYIPNPTSLESYSFDDNATRTVTVNGSTSYDTLVPIARGCGASLSGVTRSDSLTMNDLVKIGTSKEGKEIYTVKDLANSLWQKAYDEYKQAATSPISRDDFVKQHAVIVIPNADKELLVYVRQQYRIYGGCAKPVVYLYPTSTTDVSVRVGAVVTESDPYYPPSGWQHVTAVPDGQLTYQGKTYSSLFWEGQGYGRYPGITDGTVVARADAVDTIRLQMAVQGFSAQEIDDFLAYWQPKIPDAPYIRLTWLDTAEMNALAPLTVSPQPDSVLRAFLDMDGYQTRISLPPQTLQTVERRGFTVVEWGGLTATARH